MGPPRGVPVPGPALRYAEAHGERFLRELAEFMRIPSVSADPAHAPDVRRCASWLARHLRSIGMERAEVVPTRGAPAVVARWTGARTRPTLLVYGHYDVQPVAPVRDWRTPPFDPVVRGQELCGRGASDDKGQLWAHVKALECYLRTQRALPVNVTCLFEGEEEIGSPQLRRFLERHRRSLFAHAAVASDTRMVGTDRPAIVESLRGSLTVEVEVRGARRDLHSGNFGGAVANPLQAVCAIVASLVEPNGRVAVPGFYGGVRRWSQEERAYMRAHGPSDAEILRSTGAEPPPGEPGYSLYERTTIRPALTVTSVSGGGRGPAARAAIPARASARLDVRLVPDQDPFEVEDALTAHIARVTPPGARALVRTTVVAGPTVLGRSQPGVSAAAAAYERGFGAAPVFVRSGGTIPFVEALRDQTGLSVVLMGLGPADDGRHGPNEKLYLPNLWRGIATSIWFMSYLGTGVSRRPAATAASRTATGTGHR